MYSRSKKSWFKLESKLQEAVAARQKWQEMCRQQDVQWKQVDNPGGQPAYYFHNIQTNKTAWEKPARPKEPRPPKWTATTLPAAELHALQEDPVL